MYKFEKIDLSSNGIEICVQLLKEVFPGSSKFSYEFIDWEYIQNPLGKVVGFNAFLDNEIAAHYATQPILAKINNKEYKGLLSFNTATHPRHRGKKLFTKLANLTYNYAKELGYRFVIGVANANSTYGFINKLGFQSLGPLVIKIGLGYFKYKQKGEYVEYAYERIWDKKSLAWRLSNPNARYDIINKKDFFFVTTPTRKIGISAIIGRFDMDILPEKFYRKNKRKNPQKMWMGIDQNIKWGRFLHVNLPEKLKSSPLNLIFKDLYDGSINVNPKKIKFYGIDFDVL